MADCRYSIREKQRLGMRARVGFPSEAALMEAALSSALWDRFDRYDNSANTIFVEPKGLFGVPDLVLVNVKILANQLEKLRVFAFELKLRNWRRALAQAYRYRSFANRSYVVIDSEFVQPAVARIALFQSANVGLMSFDVSGAIEVHFEPAYDRPYSPRLALRFRQGTKIALETVPSDRISHLRHRIEGFRFKKVLSVETCRT
jgi:hypothetical protein